LEKPGELCSHFLILFSLDKRRIPALKGVSDFNVKETGSDLKQQMSTSLAPAHLLFLDHPLAYHLVDG
jgi:hypothetical protein